MEKFTGYEYLLIDLANTYGKDKLLFGERIQWVKDNMHQLESLASTADSKPLYLKAVMNLRKVLSGQPSSHLVEFDAVCSGLQMMSALTGCITGATHTGLVDPDVRADAYTTNTKFMNDELGGTCDVSRGDAKDAYMTTLYGSKAEPKRIFGEDTPELNAYYVACQKTGPGAWDLLQDLLGFWQPFALKHSWKLPDGFDAVVKVMAKKEVRIEVDELDHATFTYEFFVNEGSKKGLSLVANVVHSCDAYLLRSIHRRCNYNREMLEYVCNMIDTQINLRSTWHTQPVDVVAGTKLAYYIDQYERSGMPDAVIFPYIEASNVDQLSDEHLEKLNKIVGSMMAHKPFPVVSIHDAFKAGANNMNHLRQHYINIFAEIAESNMISDILSQIHGVPCVYKKLSTNLGELIRGSNYGLC